MKTLKPGFVDSSKFAAALLTCMCNGAYAQTLELQSRPFNESSPFNTRITQNQEYQKIESPAFDNKTAANINKAIWSIPVYISSETSTKEYIIMQGSNKISVLLDDAAPPKPDPSSDGHLIIIEPKRKEIYEMWGATVAEDRIQAKAIICNSLADMGVYERWHGARAYGGSALAGLILGNELNTKINHALAIAVRPAALNWKTTNNKGYIWPASSADNNHQSTYSTSGNLHMGSRLAIPKYVSIDELTLSSTESKNLATALIEYGAYIVDTASTNLVFYAEETSSKGSENITKEDLRKITEHLQLAPLDKEK